MKTSIVPGAMFEDADLHPVMCLEALDQNIFAVSLVDGSCRIRELTDVAGRVRLSVAEAIVWRFSGPGPKSGSVAKPWWLRNRGRDPIGSHQEIFPRSVPHGGHAGFQPGDLYVGSFWHPCICLWIVGERRTIAGISLVKGTYPKEEDLAHSYAPKLTPQEAWVWRTKGPQDGAWSDVWSAAYMRASLTETEEKSDPNFRWWS